MSRAETMPALPATRITVTSLEEFRAAIAGGATDISFLDLENGTAIDVAALLKENSTVTSLHLGRGDKIGSGGVKALARMLQVNTTLTDFDLTCHNINLAVAQAFAKTIEEENRTLTSLHLDHGTITFLPRRDGTVDAKTAMVRAIEKSIESTLYRNKEIITGSIANKLHFFQSRQSPDGATAEGGAGGGAAGASTEEVHLIVDYTPQERKFLRTNPERIAKRLIHDHARGGTMEERSDDMRIVARAIIAHDEAFSLEPSALTEEVVEMHKKIDGEMKRIKERDKERSKDALKCLTASRGGMVLWELLKAIPEFEGLLPEPTFENVTGLKESKLSTGKTESDMWALPEDVLRNIVEFVGSPNNKFPTELTRDGCAAEAEEGDRKYTTAELVAMEQDSKDVSATTAAPIAVPSPPPPIAAHASATIVLSEERKVKNGSCGSKSCSIM